MLQNGPLKYWSMTVFNDISAEMLRNFYMDNHYRKQWFDAAFCFVLLFSSDRKSNGVGNALIVSTSRNKPDVVKVFTDSSGHLGTNAIWAVMTVVVVMEVTVGGTLCKGLNRGLGTLLAGSLAFFIRYLACIPGQIFQAIFIGAAVFLLGAAATYVRFIPYIKKNYDYGVLIFLLTFNLIIVSSYRVDNVWTIGKDRMITITIGVVLCLMMTILVFPNWSGEELHNSTISKLEGLANSIEVSVMEYFYDSEKQENEDDSCEDPIYKCYEAILDSKAKDETLAMQANWEPRYSRICHRIPWQQYTKVGASLRHFSYTVVALHGCLQSEIQ
ncbi:hypothetical protein RYX36_004323, partial [Vicia faba]